MNLSLVRLLRTPLLLSVLVLGIVCNPAFIPNLVVLANTYSPERSAWGAMSMRLDYLLYLPNVVTYLAALLGTWLLIELKHAVLPRNRSRRDDLITVGVGALLAVLPLVWMTNVKPGGLQRLLFAAQAGLLWLWMMCNAGLYTMERFIARHRWCISALEWTFPVSDMLCFRMHRQRLDQRLGWLRWIPSFGYALLLASALWLQGQILWGAIRAERVPVRTSDTYWAIHADGGFWFSNGDWWDPTSGIWYYDERSHTAAPYIRVMDLRRFYLDGGFFYFHDRYDNCIYKIEAATRRVVWKVPTKPAGTFEPVMQGNLLFAVGEGGNIVVVTTDGQLVAQRQVYRTWAPQALPGGRVAFIAGDRRVSIWNRRLEPVDETLMPLPQGVRDFAYPPGHRGVGTVTLWTEYDVHANVLYIVTFWGGIFRYDVARRVWLASLHAAPGLRSIAVDSRNGLLFAWNYFQGYIDVMDLETGRHLRYILANALGRFINLDPVARRAIINTHGHGLYRFDYAGIAAAVRSPAHASP